MTRRNIPDPAARIAYLVQFGSIEAAHKLSCSLDDSPPNLNDRAVILHKLGRSEEALPLLDRSIAESPEYFIAAMNRRFIEIAIKSAIRPPPPKIISDTGSPKCDAPKISVVIPTYDRPDFLKSACDSVLTQTMKSVELIVVNDGGSRSSEEIVSGLGSNAIRHIRIEHSGISAALNMGVSLARGKYIAYLDDDDVYYPDHIEILAIALDQNPDCPAAYSLAKNAIQRKSGDEWKTIKEIVHHQKPFTLKELINNNRIPTTGSVMHRREAFDRVGGFNPNIICSQDWDFYIRLSSLGEMKLVEKVTVEHRDRIGGPAQLSANRRILRNAENTVRYIHRAAALTSVSPWHRGYNRALREASSLCRNIPEIIEMTKPDLLMQKPYSAFARLGQDFADMGENEKARAAFGSALKISPWEIKLYPMYISPRPDNPR